MSPLAPSIGQRIQFEVLLHQASTVITIKSINQAWLKIFYCKVIAVNMVISVRCQRQPTRGHGFSIRTWPLDPQNSIFGTTLLLDCLPPGQRDGASRRDSRLSSPFPPNFTKITMARSTVKISAQFKKGVNHHIITQVLGQKYPNLGENGRPGGARKWREKSKKLFFPPFLTHRNLHRAPNCSKITLPGRHSSHWPACEGISKKKPNSVLDHKALRLSKRVETMNIC